MTWWLGYGFCQESYYITNTTFPYLVEIFSQEQQNFITQTIVDSELLEVASWWIGLKQRYIPHEGFQWQWYNSRMTTNFTAWSQDYPMNGHTTAASLVRDLNYEWIDVYQPLPSQEDDIEKSYPICQFIPF